MKSYGLKLRILVGVIAVLAAVCLIVPAIALKSDASNIWPQKSTAPFYCIDGGKSWKQSDRYAIYKYNTLPNPVTTTQAKRLFWGYPDNWKALKNAVASSGDGRIRSALSQILATDSGPNTVKYIKDDPTTMFAYVADHPEIENLAIEALVQAAESGGGKTAPEAIRNATSEDKAAVISVAPFSAGPGALESTFELTEEFVRDIAKIEPQSVYDNGSGGGQAGWIDASQDKNIAKSVLGDNLYEITWSGDSIKIRNNGSAVANENAVGSTMSEEEKYNKTDVIFKITMRGKSGWVTSGVWDDDYLYDWMDFKACTNEPGHQRLYQAHIQITPSDQVFYIRVNQTGDGAGGADFPEYGVSTPEIDFNIYRHEETFDSHYNVRLTKYDSETDMPLKGSQFYLYEKFEDADLLSDREECGGLITENLSFGLWDGFEIFAEQTTDGSGVITHTDERSYKYSKTYCDGHLVPVWAVSVEEGGAGDEGDEDDHAPDEGGADELVRDKNRAAAAAWLELVEDCENRADSGQGTHFHWLDDENAVDEVSEVLDTGLPRSKMRSGAEDEDGGQHSRASMRDAFRNSGCQEDCEATYNKFIGLRFTYTWKEVQARPGYILHGLHSEDIPLKFVTTNSSEGGAVSSEARYSVSDISGNIWYSGNGEAQRVGSAVLRSYAEEDLTKKDRETADGERNVSIIRRVIAETPDDAAVIGRDGANGRGFAKVPESGAVQKAGPGKVFYPAGDDEGSYKVESSSDAERAESAETPSNAAHRVQRTGPLIDTRAGSISALFERLLARYRTWEAYDSDWEIAGNFGDFSAALSKAKKDGIDHLEKKFSGYYSYCGSDDGADSWPAYDHRTEGQVHINKRDLDIYKNGDDKFDSYAQTEGDTTLGGAVYGLFAADDIIHPDSEVGPDGDLTNTGVVYKKNDLVAQAVMDDDGNADFIVYTRAPGETYDYTAGAVIKRPDAWDGPGNLYENNNTDNGNYWIGRPLILGDYYVKELSRSEGFELSVNGMDAHITNRGTGFDTPAGAFSSRGTVTVSTSEMNADMAGEEENGDDGSETYIKGAGYDEFLFTAVSSGTGGYEIVINGIPKDQIADVVRIDTGMAYVTGPHIVGTQEKIVTDERGTVWVKAESDTSNLKYIPEKDDEGSIIGQRPCVKSVPQTLTAEQVPEKRPMKLEKLEIDEEEELLETLLSDVDLSDESERPFRYLKAALEEILGANGYGIPVNYEGRRSTEERPVYSRGVRKGETDIYEMTADRDSPAVKTVYGAAVHDLEIKDEDQDKTLAGVLIEILSWYQENPQWSFGGIDSITRQDPADPGKDTVKYIITIYAGDSTGDSRRFFTMKTGEGGKADVDKVYSVIEDNSNKRWFYQEYESAGDYSYEVTSRYYLADKSNDGGRRYYIDVTLTPAVYIADDGSVGKLEHDMMAYFDEGKEIIDYILGDLENGYKVPLTETEYVIGETSEWEMAEAETSLYGDCTWDDHTGQLHIPVKMGTNDEFGNEISDQNGALTLRFCVKLNAVKPVTLTAKDINSLGSANVWGYTPGDEIGYAQYLVRFKGVSITASTPGVPASSGTYIVTATLAYRGQQFVSESGGSGEYPLQVLERPIKQRVSPIKSIESVEGIVPGDPDVLTNFRFKIYLKSNLERLYCDENGNIVWTDRYGTSIDIAEYLEAYPELVPKIYTKMTDRPLLETVRRRIEDGTGGYRTVESYNYEKFFDAVAVADTDKREKTDGPRSTSFKPFTAGLYSDIENEVNTSDEARENALRSDAVRQFAVDWYLKEEVSALTSDAADGSGAVSSGDITDTDELYDKALYRAILRAEEYLAPFFAYDIGSFYEIAWDAEADGGRDGDCATLSADLIKQNEDDGKWSAYGISEYLPYGEYVIVEQQPYSAALGDFPNRHYKTDAPKEIVVPSVYASGEDSAHPEYSSKYIYNAKDTPAELASQYLIRFNEERAENATEPVEEYVINAENDDGIFEVYPYGLDIDQTADHYEPYRNSAVAEYYHYRSDSENASVEDNVMFTGGAADPENMEGIYFKDGVAAMTGVLTAYDGKYASMLVPWSVPETDDIVFGNVQQAFFDRVYYTDLRIEKLDAETGEPILHDDGIFALYRAERDESQFGEGNVRRYEKDTVIYGSREFLTAMGAYDIEPVRGKIPEILPGRSKGPYRGIVPAGTFICQEENCVIFTDETGCQTGDFHALSTVADEEVPGILQTVGYFKTPGPVPAGVYVLAELKAPDGYVRSSPVAVEVYSDGVTYYKNGTDEKVSAVIFPYETDPDGNKPENIVDTARIYVNDTASSVEISKIKTPDTDRRMKISGRVEGDRVALSSMYGAENLEFAFNPSGTYMGFGWIKGTAEYLKNRMDAGERVEPVYDKGVFQGYGYVTGTLDSASHENRYVKGAELTLFDAVSVRDSGDREDHAFDGVTVTRDRTGNVTDISVREGYAGERTEFLFDEEENVWHAGTIERTDTPVLFYDLGGLDVTFTDSSGLLCGYGRDGRPLRVTYMTPSIYALRDGVPVFELAGGDLARVVYSESSRAFTAMDPDTRIYRLDGDKNRTALVDGYTGLAYVEYYAVTDSGESERSYYLWPVSISKDKYGNVLARDKIITGRPAEINAGTADAYITGTYDVQSGKFEKISDPVYDEFGMVRYYRKSGASYTKGDAVYDRDNDYIRYRYDDLLEDYNRAAYTILDHDPLFDNGDGKEESSIPESARLNRRYGEAFIIPNVWISGEATPNDPTDDFYSPGQPDLLRRVYPGEYILEETGVPDGYTAPLPVAVCVAGTEKKQRVLITDEATKVEISKIDAPVTHKVPLEIEGVRQERLFVEGKAGYGYGAVPGASLALYRAKRVTTSDLENFPDGYCFVTEESTPFAWNVDNPEDNSPIPVSGMWISDDKPRYFEGIPAGDFILEETDAPDGLIPAVAWITIEKTGELQSFIVKNDHTKLEIEKVTGSGTDKNPLPRSDKAVLALYEAVTDMSGEPLKENGEYVWREEDLIDSWEAYDRSSYFYGFKSEYEKLYGLYGNGFDTVRWSAAYDTDPYETGAVLKMSEAAYEGGNLRQIWETDDGSLIKVTVTVHDGLSGSGFASPSGNTFEYQFDYREGFCEKWPDIRVYETLYGEHRFDRIPAGYYVLVETETPEGYVSAPPKLITVKEIDAVQRYEIDNEKIAEDLPAGPEPEPEPEPEPSPDPGPWPSLPEDGGPEPGKPPVPSGGKPGGSITVIPIETLTDAYSVKTGFINAMYDVILDGRGSLVIPPKGNLHFTFSKTGDESRPELYIFGVLLCAVILTILYWLKRTIRRDMDESLQ